MPAITAVVPVNQGGRWQNQTATKLFAVVPSDTVPVGPIAQIIVTVGGNLPMIMWDGTTQTLAVVAGEVIQLSPKIIKATLNTATVFGAY